MEYSDVSSMVGSSAPVKIIHVIIGLGVGGAELMLKRLIGSHASLEEIEHSVVSLTDLGVVGDLLKAEGVQVTVLGMRNMLDVPRVVYQLFTLLRESRPEIVQTWMYHADLLGGLVARVAGVKSVIWGVRTTDVGSGGKRSTVAIRKICALLSFFLPNVIVCAANSSRKAHAMLGYCDDKMLVIPNGFEISRLQASAQQRDSLRTQLGIRPEELVVGSLGRFNPVKDQANFIAASALVAKRYPSAKFLLVGRDLDVTNIKIMQLLEATGYSDRFILLGERQDVAVCLKAMDIFCLHSRTEGFPNVLGEAMCMALPCVTTDVGDAAYLLGGNGVVVPSQDAPALAEGLSKMFELDSEARFTMGKAGQLRVYENFTLERASQRFLELYKKIIASRFTN